MECYDTVEGGDDDDDNNSNIYIGEGSGDDGEKRSGELLGRMFRLGKKVVITGVVMSSVPLLVPPLLVMSAVACALSLPFGFVFASYACTDKLMSKLLLPPEYDEDQEQYVVDAAFEYEQLEEGEEGQSESEEDAVEMRVDASFRGSSLDEQVGGDLEEGTKTSPETHARVDELRINDAEERKQDTSISESDDYNVMGMNADGYFTANIAPQLEREAIYHVAAMKLIDAVDKLSTEKEDDHEEGEEKAVETGTESVDEIHKFPTGKEDDHKEEEEEEEDENVVGTPTQTEVVDEIDKISTGKEDENVAEIPTTLVGEIDKFPTGKEVYQLEEEDEKVVETQTELVDEIDKFSTGKEEEDEKAVERRTESVDEIDKFPSGKEDGHKEEHENVVGTQTEVVGEIDKFSTGKEDDHKEEEDEKVEETQFEPVDEIYKFGKKVNHMDEEDEKVVRSRTEPLDEIDNLELGKEDDHEEEVYEKVVEAQTESVDEIDKFSTGKENDFKEKEDEDVVETRTELVEEIDKFPTGEEVYHMEDEKVVETQTKLVDEIDELPTSKEDYTSYHKEEVDEKAAETRTESVEEINKFPTGKEDGEKAVETRTFSTVAVPAFGFPLQKDTDDKMDSSSGKNSTTAKEVIIERQRAGKRKFKASSSAFKVISGKRKGLSQGAARELEGVSIQKGSDQMTTSVADKNQSYAGEEAVVHKSGDLSSDHAYKEEKAGENIALSDVLDENEGDGSGNDPKQQKTVITMVYNNHPQQEENYTESKTPVSGDSELKNNKEITLKDEKDDTIISGDIGGGNSEEIRLRDGDDENIWKTMEAIRGIVGYKAPASDSRIEELKALYLFTGIEPPASSDHSSHEFHNNLSFLMSVIGLK